MARRGKFNRRPCAACLRVAQPVRRLRGSGFLRAGWWEHEWGRSSRINNVPLVGGVVATNKPWGDVQVQPMSVCEALFMVLAWARGKRHFGKWCGPRTESNFPRHLGIPALICARRRRAHHRRLPCRHHRSLRLPYLLLHLCHRHRAGGQSDASGGVGRRAGYPVASR